MFEYLCNTLYNMVFGETTDSTCSKIDEIIEHNIKYSDYIDLCYPYDMQTSMRKQLSQAKSVDELSIIINELNKHNDLHQIQIL